MKKYNLLAYLIIIMVIVLLLPAIPFINWYPNKPRQSVFYTIDSNNFDPILNNYKTSELAQKEIDSLRNILAYENNDISLQMHQKFTDIFTTTVTDLYSNINFNDLHKDTIIIIDGIEYHIVTKLKPHLTINDKKCELNIKVKKK